MSLIRHRQGVIHAITPNNGNRRWLKGANYARLLELTPGTQILKKWVATGALVEGVAPAGKRIRMSQPIGTLGLVEGQAIRFGDSLETVYVRTVLGTTTWMRIDPVVPVVIGMELWKWE